MKNRLLIVGLGLLVFVIGFIMPFAFIFSFLQIFINFGLLNAKVALNIAFWIGISFGLLAIAYLILYEKVEGNTKFGIFLSLHYPKLLLIYIILLIVFISIKSEIIWTYDTLKDVIALEWTIFGISIAIFLVWNMLIVKHLTNIQPQKPSTMNLLQKRGYIIKKGEFYQTASMAFNSVTMLIINLLVLILATGSIFILKEQVTLMNQNIAIVSFYFCTNTIISLFMDIIKPLNEERKRILSESKVTSKDIAEQNNIEGQIKADVAFLKNLDTIESLDAMQKIKLVFEIAERLGIFESVQNSEGLKKEKTDDQL